MQARPQYSLSVDCGGVFKYKKRRRKFPFGIPCTPKNNHAILQNPRKWKENPRHDHLWSYTIYTVVDKV